MSGAIPWRAKDQRSGPSRPWPACPSSAPHSPFGELREWLREIPRVCRAQSRLADDRLGDARVAMPEDGHVVVGIEEAATVRLVDPDALRTHCVDGAGVRERGQQPAERLRPPAGEWLARCR